MLRNRSRKKHLGKWRERERELTVDYQDFVKRYQGKGRIYRNKKKWLENNGRHLNTTFDHRHLSGSEKRDTYLIAVVCGLEAKVEHFVVSCKG